MMRHQKKLVIARDHTTGRLYRFKTDALDIKAIKKGDAVNINLVSKKITAISGAVRNYPVIQPDKAEPVGILATLRINNAEPIASIVSPKINNAEPVGKPTINNEEPISEIVSIQIDNAEPVGKVEINTAEPVGKPTINNAEPVGIITAKNKLTGKAFQFKAPAAIAKTLKVGDPVYAQPVNNIRIDNVESINDFAIVQSSYGSNGQMNSYGYPATSGEGTTGNANATDKWVVTPVATMKGVLGALDINFPAGVDRDIWIYQPADNKYVASVSKNAKSFPIAPGEYRFTISEVAIENVPIKKGHVTRLKSGFINIVSEGVWHINDETKEKQHTSGNKPRKVALPVGSYQLNLGGQFYPVIIKDGETVEY